MGAPFTQQSFDAAIEARPDLHPAKAIMQSLGTGIVQETPAEALSRLRQRLADMLSFGLSSAGRIADLKAQIARQERIAGVEAQLDEVEASFQRCVEHAATAAFARKIAAA